MTRLINAAEVAQVISMSDCIEAMAQAFAEEARGVAANHPRQRYRVPRQLDVGQSGYWANMIAGAVPSMGVAALRYDSSIVRESERDGQRRMEFDYPSGRSWGFVLLFSLTTGEPLAIFQDFSLSPLRVGATTGVAVRALAPANASRIGLLGSGNQAQRNLEAICLGRQVDEVRVYSPSRQHREAFAEQMGPRLGVDVIPVDDARGLVEWADVLMCATNSSLPVFDGDWLRPGQLVVTIANTDHVMRRTEADDTTMLRADVIVLNSKDTLISNQQRELLDLIDRERFGWDKVTELGQVLIGAHPGRTSDDQIIYYKSNTGVGIQFAAAGALIYKACEERGLGHEIPTEWFGADVSDWLAKGFNPAP
ncbi:MAG TPA: ornithine cyclodeaminase family protein [Chloroflexota bacterium]